MRHRCGVCCVGKCNKKMKNKNHLLRIGLTVLISWLIIYKTYQFKFSNFILDEILYPVIGIIGLIAWGIMLSKDLKLFKAEKQAKYLTTAIIGGVSLITILLINWSLNRTFNKPTLVKVFYDGDFNGVGIDFKKDGTYIFDNFCLGSDYEYGIYQINGDEIELDRKEIDNIIKSKRLRIASKTTDYQDEIEEENYLFQIDEFGHSMENELSFRVIIDNRKE
jgi:hypothetical protein